jgi:hypothetical protein
MAQITVTLAELPGGVDRGLVLNVALNLVDVLVSKF